MARLLTNINAVNTSDYRPDTVKLWPVTPHLQSVIQTTYQKKLT